MLKYEDFGSNLEAHLSYAGHRPLQEAWEILRRRLDDGSWKEAPRAWMERLQHRWYGTGVEASPAEELRTSLIEQVLHLDLASSERVVHEVLPALFLRWTKLMVVPADVDRLVAWFVKQARPGHASLAADIVSAAYGLADELPSGPSICQSIHPLAKWLVLNGAAELRSGRRHRLSLDVVHAFHSHGTGLERRTG